MTERQGRKAELSRAASVDRVFEGIEYYFPTDIRDEDNELVYIKLRAMEAADPISGDFWRAADSRYAHLIRGRYISGGQLVLAKGIEYPPEVQFSVDLDSGKASAKRFDDCEPSPKEMLKDFERGWAVITNYGEDAGEFGWYGEN